MNCQDFFHIVDSSDVSKLTAAERGACEAHASTCRQCAPHWVAFQSLAAISVPSMPAEVAMQCETLAAMEARAASRRRGARRLVLLGAVLIVAAAAAMLAMRLVPDETTATLVADAPTNIVSEPAPADASADAEPVKTPPLPAGESTQPENALPPPAQLRVRMLPLKNDGTDGPTKAAINAYYAAVLDGLRAVPSLTVFEYDPAGIAPAGAADFQITLSGSGPGAGQVFTTGIQAEKVGADGATSFAMNSYVQGGLDPCVGVAKDDLSCHDPLGIAAFQVRQLRLIVFPPDASLRGLLQAQLLDDRMPPNVRLKALGDMMTLNRRSSNTGASSDQISSARADADLVRGVVALASVADPAVRAQVWRSIRDVHTLSLVPPLIDAAEHELDEKVRVEAVSSLVQGYASDERVRSALEVIASDDSRPLVRAVAQRGISGNAAWSQYMVASLKDQSRSDAERIEALLYATYDKRTPGTVASNSPLTFRLLDDEAIRALAEVLPRLHKAGEIDAEDWGRLSRDIVRIKHPAITEFLLGNLNDLKGDAGSVDTWVIVSALMDRSDDEHVSQAFRNSTDPGVRGLLKEMSVSDADPDRREAAARIVEAWTVKDP